MARKNTIKLTRDTFEQKEDLMRLVLYTIIVPKGQGENISRILKANHVSATFYMIGEGTASSEAREILGSEDTKKDIVYALIGEEYVTDLKKEFDAYFLMNKRNRGIAYTTKLNAFMGVKLYKFFTQTVRG